MGPAKAEQMAMDREREAERLEGLVSLLAEQGGLSVLVALEHEQRARTLRAEAQARRERW